ncbi:hypothetical protein [Arthrobacter sp. OAP107]|uniref:hypothetical protein n=1 Tax=Arthrobacter sp. OAP107 TaxID=3156445 RepID=UPI0033952B7E
MTLTPDLRDCLWVRVTHRADMDRQLNDAVERLREGALSQSHCGILVIRRSDSDFSLELHSSVPFGLTHEVDAR